MTKSVFFLIYHPACLHASLHVLASSCCLVCLLYWYNSLIGVVDVAGVKMEAHPDPSFHKSHNGHEASHGHP